MASRILVTGGTGTLGRLVVPLLQRAGHDVRVLSRTAGAGTITGDLTTGAGVSAAVEGIEIVVHCAGTAQGDEHKARHLVAAASGTDVRHLVFISVVGADRVPVTSAVDRTMFGYFAAKRAAEQAITESGLPWTTLRATQFHDLTFNTVQQMSKLPVVPVPSEFRFQPVDTGEVAARLVELAASRPAGLVPDLAGPRAYDLSTLVRSYLRAADKHRVVMPVRIPGRAAAAIRAGANLALDRAVGRRTWEDFLAARLQLADA